MKPRFILLSTLSVLALSGCESTTFNKLNPFGQPAATAQTSADVQMREDNGMVDMSYQNNMGTAGNSSVDVFDIASPSDGGFQPQGYTDTYNAGGPAMPSYTNGVASFDPSVTIYPVDGSAPMMAGNNAGGYGYDSGYAAPQSYDQNNYGQSYSGGYGGGNQIFFTHGSSRLGGGDRSKLSSVAEQAKFAPVNRVTVAGYASQPTQAGSQSVEGHILNLKESMNRTFAVSRELMHKGVPAEKIKAVSWGSTKSTGSEQQDRRVDVIMGEQ